MSKRKIADIKKLIDELFSDTSVPPKVTRDALEDLKEYIDGCLETLP
jgi:uncharacterized protein (UPF0147 family)